MKNYRDSPTNPETSESRNHLQPKMLTLDRTAISQLQAGQISHHVLLSRRNHRIMNETEKFSFGIFEFISSRLSFDEDIKVFIYIRLSDDSHGFVSTLGHHKYESFRIDALIDRVVSRKSLKSSSESFHLSSSSKIVTLSSCSVCDEQHLLFEFLKPHPNATQPSSAAIPHQLFQNCLSSAHVRMACSSANRCEFSKLPQSAMNHYDNESYRLTENSNGLPPSVSTTPCVAPFEIHSASAVMPAHQCRGVPTSGSSSIFVAPSTQVSASFEALLFLVCALILDLCIMCRALFDSESQSYCFSRYFATQMRN